MCGRTSIAQQVEGRIAVGCAQQQLNAALLLHVACKQTARSGGIEPIPTGTTEATARSTSIGRPKHLGRFWCWKAHCEYQERRTPMTGFSAVVMTWLLLHVACKQNPRSRGMEPIRCTHGYRHGPRHCQIGSYPLVVRALHERCNTLPNIGPCMLHATNT